MLEVYEHVVKHGGHMLEGARFDICLGLHAGVDALCVETLQKLLAEVRPNERLAAGERYPAARGLLERAVL